MYIWFIRPKDWSNASCTFSSNCFEMTHEIFCLFSCLCTIQEYFQQNEQFPLIFFFCASILFTHFKHDAYGIIYVLNCFSFFSFLVFSTNFAWCWKLKVISLSMLNFIVFYFSFQRKKKEWKEKFAVHLKIQLYDINILWT